MGMAKSSMTSMTRTLRTSVAAALLVSLSACSWNDQRTETMGGVLGGILGGVVGSKMGKGTGQNISIIIGATLGTMWGQDIAKGMTQTDKIYSERTTQDTLEYGKPGETATWSNPDSGNSGAVTIEKTYANDKGENCRQFETTVNVEGEERTATGTACRTSDGEWQVVDNPEVAT